MFLYCDTEEYVNVNHVRSFVEREDGTVVLRVTTGNGDRIYTTSMSVDSMLERSDRKQFILALPGYTVLLAKYDGAARNVSVQQIPLIGWELGSFGDLMPVSIQGRLDPLADWAVKFPDGSIHSFYDGSVNFISDWTERVYARHQEQE